MNSKAQSDNFLNAARRRPLLLVIGAAVLLAITYVFVSGKFSTQDVFGPTGRTPPSRISSAMAAKTYALGDHIDMTPYTQARNGIFPVTMVKMLTEPAFNMFVLNDDNDYVSKEIRAGRVWAPELTPFFTKRMREKCKQGGVMFDVGANLGYFSLYASAMGCEVHAFEMQPMVRDIFRLSYTVNPNTHGRINIVHAAVGKTSGETVTVKYFLGTSDLGSAGLSDELSSEFKDSAVVAEKMITTSLDDYVDQVGVKNIGYVKMDVEGYEWEAIQGFVRTIKRKGIHDIIIEVRKYNFDRIIGLFNSLGYTAYDLNQNAQFSIVSTDAGLQALHARQTNKVGYTDIFFTVDKTAPTL